MNPSLWVLLPTTSGSFVTSLSRRSTFSATYFTYFYTSELSLQELREFLLSCVLLTSLSVHGLTPCPIPLEYYINIILLLYYI